ncbi:PREDICTED: LOW QUALITY PROTEIN: uncharacterized protein ARIH2OS [Propithecus coquereli]|uniref:LOW QUALITY PROTEIN: uncharacterized protein ARIH2OS n=1 Tax=Propithecus coquereli TaxID=379532 RepID=UPI00063F8599|nr:PREDICTED: LOW QUALITY PROTEIN: uncharacterized protein ARIH2OS [Propithecus coquereli]
MCGAAVYRRRGAPGLEGDGEGGAPARPGKRAGRPPHRPAKVNKAATHAAHLPGAAAHRPLSPDGPDQVKPGQRGQIGTRRRRRQRADAGRARAASSGGVVPAPPEVFGSVASLPARGRPGVDPRWSAGAEISAYASKPSLGGPRAATIPGFRFPRGGLLHCPVLQFTLTIQDCIVLVSFYSIGIVIMTSSYLLGPIVKYYG